MLINITHLNINSLESSEFVKYKGIMLSEKLRTRVLENLVLILQIGVIIKDVWAGRT